MTSADLSAHERKARHDVIRSAVRDRVDLHIYSLSAFLALVNAAIFAFFTNDLKAATAASLIGSAVAIFLGRRDTTHVRSRLDAALEAATSGRTDRSADVVAQMEEVAATDPRKAARLRTSVASPWRLPDKEAQ